MSAWVTLALDTHLTRLSREVINAL
jgi:hypothetical protein